MTLFSRCFVAIILTVLFTFPAFSAETKKIPYSLTYVGFLSGPSIVNPLSPYQPSKNTGQISDTPLYTKNYLTGGYRFSPVLSSSFTVYGRYAPVLNHPYSIRETYVTLSHSNLYTLGKFKFYGDLRAYLPIPDYARNTLHQITQLRATPKFAYQYNSQLKLGLELSFRQSFYTNDPSKYWRQFIYIAPNMTYQLTDQLAVGSLLELSFKHNTKQRPFFQSDDNDFEPSLIWSPTPRLTLAPYLDIKINGPRAFEFASTSINLLVVWSVL